MYEWALDWYSSSWYAGAGNECNNCANIANASPRVLRGGVFNNYGSNLRAANRVNYNPDNHNNYVGFRCARTP
jgi:formylglycine-generating enzyme required for sulfatase activity